MNNEGDCFVFGIIVGIVICVILALVSAPSVIVTSGFSEWLDKYNIQDKARIKDLIVLYDNGINPLTKFPEGYEVQNAPKTKESDQN